MAAKGKKAEAEDEEDQEKESDAKESKGAKDAKEGEEGEGGEGEAAEGEGGLSKKKKLIIIAGAALMLLVIAGGGGAYFLLSGPEAEEAEGEGEHAKTAAEAPVFFDLPQILVNLNTGGKSVSFIKTTVTLELASKEDVPQVEANLPRLMDSYNTFLREMKSADLYGSAGVYRLREEMLIRANKMLAPVKVKDVLFREILVQ